MLHRVDFRRIPPLSFVIRLAFHPIHKVHTAQSISSDDSLIVWSESTARKRRIGSKRQDHTARSELPDFESLIR